MPWTETHEAQRANTKPKRRKADKINPLVLGELAALATLHTVFRSAGPTMQRLMQQHLGALVEDWSRPDPPNLQNADAPNTGAPNTGAKTTEANQALRLSARRFGRPALNLINPSPPDLPINRP